MSDYGGTYAVNGVESIGARLGDYCLYQGVKLMKFKIIGNKKINGIEPGEVIEIKDEAVADSLSCWWSSLKKLKANLKIKKELSNA